MKPRRRKGATLGLVAVCVLVIIILGIGCFFLAKLFGGGREIANSTDAGSLNVARQALLYSDPSGVLKPGLQSDFGACAIKSAPQNGAITLLTYNRCVGQALLVAMNAYEEGTGAAKGNAGTVLGELSKIGDQLKKDLKNGGNFSSYFSNTTGANNVKMVGNSAVSQSAFKAGWMKTGGSTNIWFNSNTLPAAAYVPASLSNDLNNKNGNQFTPAGNQNPGNMYAMPNYLPGYISYTVPGIGSVMGVPNFPQQQPHLVSIADFTKQTTAASAISAGSNPPNAFCIDSNVQEKRSGSFGGAVAAAIVGAVKPASGFDPTNEGMAFDFPAAIPGGYVIIANLAGSAMPAGYGTVKGDENNIFNNELYTGGGIEVSSAGSGSAFSTNIGQVNAWATYNASEVPNSAGTTGTYNGNTFTYDSNNRNPNLAPPGYSPTMAPNAPNTNVANQNIYFSSNGNTASQAQLSDLLKITGTSTNCLKQLNQDGNLSGSCWQNLGAFESEYNPGPGNNMSPADPQQIYSAVDMAKGLLIYHFNQGGSAHGGAEINASGGDVPITGMGIYENPNFMGQATPVPQWDMPLVQGTGPNATINNFLNQIQQEGNACAVTNVKNRLLERCWQIQPAAKKADILALLDQQCAMGSTLYIYRQDLTNPNSPLTISQQPPSTRWDQTIEKTPDGQASATPCMSNYGLVGTIVDSFAGSPKPPSGTPGLNGNPSGWSTYGGGFGGDDNLHEAPFTEVNGVQPADADRDALVGHDSAAWVDNSGYHNFLGSLTFSNQVTGDAHFSRPN